MSQDRVRYELDLLEKAGRALREEIERLRTAARYAKTPERSGNFVREVQAVRSHLDAALRVREGAEEPAADSQLGGWLRRRLSKMARTIVSEDAPVPGEAGGDGDEPPAGGFRGDSWAIALPGLLGFLEHQRKSGELKIKLPAEEVTLEFEDGALVMASSDNTPPEERIGELLVQQGAVSKERLESFLLCFRASNRLLGEALLQGELVDKETLRRVLDVQAQLLFRRLLAADSVQYVFREGRPDVAATGPRMNITALLLEHARTIDEASDRAARAADESAA